VTSYEAASLALHTAEFWVAVAQLAATTLVGIGEIAIVWHGIRVMQRDSETRAREQNQRHTEVMAALQAREARAHKQDQRRDQRHTETMAALQAQIARIESTAPPAAAVR